MTAAPRRGKRLILGTLGAVGGIVALLAGAVFAFLFSPGGFQRFVVPAVGTATGWTVSVGGGHLTPNGTIVASGLVVEAPEQGMSLRVDSLHARVALSSLVGGQTPHVRLAVLRGADLTFGPATEEALDEASSELRIPLRIDRLVALGGTVRVHDGSRTSARVGVGDLRLTDLTPGAEAALALAANLAFAPGDSTAATDAHLDLTATVTQDEPGTTIGWVSKGAAQVVPAVGPAPLRAVTTFALDSDGTARTDDIAGKLTAAASRGRTALGVARAEAAWKGGDTPSVVGEVVLEGLGTAFLNPVLAIAAPVQLRTGRVDGRVTASTVGPEVVFDGVLTGQDLSFTGTGGQAPTSPVALRSEQNGVVALDWNSARIDVAALTVDQAGRRVVSAHLAEPLSLDLGDAPPTDAEPARLVVDLDRVALADLRPWVALTGGDPLAEVTKGTLQGEVLAAIGRKGRSVRVTGTWEARDVVADGSGPFGVRHDLDATIEDFERWSVEPRTAAVTYQGRALATLTPTIVYDGGTGALSVNATMQAEDGPAALQRLGVVPEWVGMRSGRLSGTVAYVSTATGAEPAANVKATMGPVRLVDDGGTSRGARTLDLDLLAGFDAALTEVRLAKVEVRVRDQGPVTGLVTASGYWPLTWAAPRGGRVDVSLRDIEARGWAEMMGFVEPGAVQSLPLVGDISLIVPRDSQSVSIAGKETIGPFVPELGEGRQWTATTVEIEHGGTLADDVLGGFSLALVTKQPEKDSGRADLAGKIEFADRTAITLKGKAKGVDLSPFVVLQLGPSKEASSSATATGVDLGAYFDFTVPMDLDVLVDLEKCAYFDLPVDRGQLTVRGRDGNLRVLLDAPEVGGGKATFAAKFIVTGPDPKAEWTLRADDTDVGALVQAINYGRPTWVRARGSFVSEGRGRGVRRSIGDSLSGTFSFDLADGGFVDEGLLDFIARETGVWGFQRMGFEVARGGVTIERGRLKLDVAEVWNVETKLAANGMLYDRQSQQWRINPRVDQATWSKVAPKWNVPPYLMDDGYVALPIDITIGGTWDAPKYAVAPRSGLWEDVARGALDEIDERTGLDIGGLAEDLFGLGGDDDAPAPAPAPAPTAPRPRPEPRPVTEGSTAPAPILGKPTATPRPK